MSLAIVGAMVPGETKREVASWQLVSPRTLVVLEAKKCPSSSHLFVREARKSGVINPTNAQIGLSG